MGLRDELRSISTGEAVRTAYRQVSREASPDYSHDIDDYESLDTLGNMIIGALTAQADLPKEYTQEFFDHLVAFKQLFIGAIIDIGEQRVIYEQFPGLDSFQPPTE